MYIYRYTMYHCGCLLPVSALQCSKHPSSVVTRQDSVKKIVANENLFTGRSSIFSNYILDSCTLGILRETELTP